MSIRRRVDRNHAEIVDALRARGMTVLSLATIGKGCPDLLVGWLGIDRLVEVKAPKAHEKPATRARQATFADTWRGAPVIRATTADHVVEAFERDLFAT